MECDRIQDLNKKTTVIELRGNAKEDKAPLRSILKKAASQTIVNSDSARSIPGDNKDPVPQTNATNNIQPETNIEAFENPAFQEDEALPTENKFAARIQRLNISRDIHPFSRGNPYTACLLSDKHKRATDGSKILFWFMFAILLLGLAGGIIIMSEMYKMSDVLPDGQDDYNATESAS